MLKIYGSDLSSPSNKVRFVANHLGLKYDYNRVNLRQGEQRKPEFLQINPVGKIPAIDDHGFHLFESGAIIKYLADREKSPIYPSGLKERAMTDQWIDFLNLHVALGISKVTYNRLFAPMRGEEIDERSIKDGLTFLSKHLPVCDAQLANGKYFLGKDISLCDFTLLAVLDPAEAIDVDLLIYKNITKWRAELKAKSFYTQCHKDYRDVLNALMAKK